MDLINEGVFLFFSCTDSTSDGESQSEEHKSLKPVTCAGRQPCSNVYIVGPELHFYSDGTEIPDGEREYMWVRSILKKLHVKHTPVTYMPSVELSQKIWSPQKWSPGDQIRQEKSLKNLVPLQKKWSPLPRRGP